MNNFVYVLFTTEERVRGPRVGVGGELERGDVRGEGASKIKLPSRLPPPGWKHGESENRNGKRFLLIAFIYKLFTALYEEVLANQAMDEGAFEYITKPINCEHLEMVLMTKLALIGVGE